MTSPSTTDFRIAKNSILSFVGTATPLLAAAVCIPLLIKTLGQERFGLLTIAWILIGYFSLFDLGLSRALTREIATNIGRGLPIDHKENLEFIKIGCVSLIVIGVLLSLIVTGLSDTIAFSVLKISPQYKEEAEATISILALAIPAVTLSAGLIGALEANQRFLEVALIKIALGLFNFIAPLVSAIYDNDLSEITLLLCWFRYFTLALLAVTLLHSFFQKFIFIKVTKHSIKKILKTGGWISITNMISPIMVYMDRFVLSAIAPLSTLAWYTTPAEMLSKLLIIPQAITSAMLPVLAVDSKTEYGKIIDICKKGALTIFALTVIPTSIIYFFSNEIITLWLGSDFGKNSISVCKWLAVGILVNSIARVPFTAIQGLGRSDLSAKIHLVEVIPYLLVLYYLVHTYGATGAAMAWALRSCVDAVLHHSAFHYITSNGRGLVNIFLVVFLTSLALLPVELLSIFVRLAIVAAIIAMSFALMYKKIVRN